MVFFDSESHVSIEITDEEVRRALAYQAGDAGSEGVRKDHNLYLISADFLADRTKETVKKPSGKTYNRKTKQATRDYFGDHDFARDFWVDVDSFARWGEKMYVFAHNAKYDAQVTRGVKYLIELGYRVKGFSDTNPFILKFEKERTYIGKDGDEKETKKTILMLSSTNYYAQSLASLGDILGLPKLDFDHDAPFNMGDAIVYCRRDVAILKKAMLEFMSFIQREGLGNFSMTVAGQAFAAYRRRFMPGDTIFIHSDQRALDVERRAYAGGRNEVFTIGKVPEWTYVNDINSMYPFVMKEKLYPVKLKTFWTIATPDDVKRAIMDDYLICCDCLVDTTEAIFHKKDGKLLFPIGSFWTSLTTPELIEAYERGYIRAVKNVAVYEAGAIFAEYVDYFYNARLEAKSSGDDVHNQLYKMFLTNLYGKFGQKNIVWEKIGDTDPNELGVDTVYDPVTKEHRMIKIFGGGIWERNEDPDNLEAYDSFPGVAAHVTAYARQLLYSYIEIAGRENVHYCDTDSLFVNEEGHTNLWVHDLIDKDRLGALDLEKIGNDLEIFGCKYYFFRDKLKVKGVPKSAKKIDPDENGKPRYAVTQWGGFSDRLRDRDLTSFYNKVIIKTLKGTYDKGRQVGNRIEPFVLDEETPEAAARELAIAREQIAAAYAKDKTSAIGDAVDRYGFIKRPTKNERYFKEVEGLPPRVLRMYFRKDKGEALDVWASDNGLSANDLIDELRKTK